MPEWWTYSLSDFLMFSPATYWRLVEHYNRQFWPLQLALAALGVALIAAADAQRPLLRRLVPVTLAAVWLWVAWAFHWQRYAPINWAAEYLAAAFAVQAALLLAASAMSTQDDGPPGVGMRAFGLALAATGVLLYPLLGPLESRPWTQAEVFGLMPEPTALATLGLLLAVGLRHRAWLAVIPILSLAVGVATAWLLRA